MKTIIDEAAEYAAMVNSAKYRRLQRKQAALDAAAISTKLIVDGKLCFKDVPKQFKQEVKEALIRRDREDLIVE